MYKVVYIYSVQIEKKEFANAMKYAKKVEYTGEPAEV